MKSGKELEYLLDYLQYCIEDLVDDVLSDSKDDPAYSAVTAANLIKCYINVMNSLGFDVPYNDLKTYFSYYKISKDDYQRFIQCMEHEKSYYRGIVF